MHHRLLIHHQLIFVCAEDELSWQVGIDVARSVVDKVAEALGS